MDRVGRAGKNEEGWLVPLKPECAPVRPRGGSFRRKFDDLRPGLVRRGEGFLAAELAELDRFAEELVQLVKLLRIEASRRQGRSDARAEGDRRRRRYCKAEAELPPTDPASALALPLTPCAREASWLPLLPLLLLLLPPLHLSS